MPGNCFQTAVCVCMGVAIFSTCALCTNYRIDMQSLVTDSYGQEGVSVYGALVNITHSTVYYSSPIQCEYG